MPEHCPHLLNKKNRNPLIQRAPGSGADSQIRTGDLILTKEPGKPSQANHYSVVGEKRTHPLSGKETYERILVREKRLP